MKIALIILTLSAFTAVFASESKVECLKSALKSGKTSEQAYQLCSVKSK